MKIASRTVSATIQVVGHHSWPNAPAEVLFLRAAHRHLFVITATFNVGHADRQLEFFMLQRKMRIIIASAFEIVYVGEYNFENCSCEHVAEKIGIAFANKSMPIQSVTVSEDTENSSTVTWS